MQRQWTMKLVLKRPSREIFLVAKCRSIPREIRIIFPSNKIAFAMHEHGHPTRESGVQWSNKKQHLRWIESETSFNGIVEIFDKSRGQQTPSIVRSFPLLWTFSRKLFKFTISKRIIFVVEWIESFLPKWIIYSAEHWRCWRFSRNALRCSADATVGRQITLLQSLAQNKSNSTNRSRTECC